MTYRTDRSRDREVRGLRLIRTDVRPQLIDSSKTRASRFSFFDEPLAMVSYTLFLVTSLVWDCISRCLGIRPMESVSTREPSDTHPGTS